MTNIQEVLKRLELSREQLSKVAERFVDGKGLANLSSYLYLQQRLQAGQYVVMELGGSNLRAAQARLKIKSAKLKFNFSSRIIKDKIPCRKKECTVEEFWGEIVRTISPVLYPNAKIGLTFAYAVEITPELDGTLLYWTKEIKVPGMVGRLVGEEFGKALVRDGFLGCRVVVLNDTVATLLAGLVKEDVQRGKVGLIGLVVGTGMNLAIVEGGQVVNTEAAGLEIGDLDLQTKFDNSVDRGSLDPGRSQLEKLIAGLYLPRIFNEIVGAERVGTTKEMIKLKGEEQEIAQALFRRSARLIGAVVCGAILRSIKGVALYRAGEQALVGRVMAEGSVFWQLPGYKRIVEETVRELCPKMDVEFVKIEEAGLVGAGIACALAV